MKRCACGKPELHYNSAAVQKMVEQMVRDQGPDIVVTVGERSWRVPRHYIAQHGLKAQELPGLGFEEVTIVARFTRDGGTLRQIQ
jgi:hypothetical protein